MSAFCVDKKLIGTHGHLVVDGGFQWVTEVPSKIWHLTGEIKHHDWCLDTLFKLEGVAIELNPPSQYLDSMMTLMSGSVHWPPPWQDVMPKMAHRRFVERVVTTTKEAIDRLSTDFYKSVWVSGNKVFSSLNRAAIDKEAFNVHLLEGKGNIPALRSFEPESDGYAREVIYNRFGSRTGRPSILSGPNILTLKREHRTVLKSRWGASGKIVQLDFSALEVRVILYETGQRCDNPDLYQELNVELFGGRMARDDVKGAIICDLYGQSKYALGQRLGLTGKHLDSFMAQVHTHFGVENLLRKIKQQFVEKGVITNRFGRRVMIDDPLDHVLINSYAQSTGADVATLGFEKIINNLQDHRVTPIFFLVDAILLDCHEEELDYVKSLNQIDIDGYTQHWPLKFEVVS